MATARPPRELPAPLVKLYRHPLRWIKNKAELTGAGLLLVHVGTLIVVALYYIVTQNHLVKPHWDGLFHTAWWPHWRHLIRNVGEGILGGTLGQLVVYNHYTRARYKEPSLLDRAEMALRIPNRKDTKRLTVWHYVAFPFLIVIYAIPGFIVGSLAVQLVAHGITHAENILAPVTHPDTWQRIRTIWTGDVAQKLVGLFASVFVARRVGKGYYDDIQLYFVERRIGRGATKPPRYWTPNIKARFNENRANAYTEAVASYREKRGSALAWVLSGGTVVGLALAVFGWYVLTYIAQ